MFQTRPFFIYPESRFGSDPDFIHPPNGLPVTIFEALFLTQFTSTMILRYSGTMLYLFSVILPVDPELFWNL